MTQAPIHYAEHAGHAKTSARSIMAPLADRMRRVSALKRAVVKIRQWRTSAIDRALNIHTPYPHPDRYRLDTQFGDAVPNEPVDYLLLRKFMKPLDLSPQDVVYDIGCGMGRVLCAFARRNVSRCIGIEFDPTLALIAKNNGDRLRGRQAEIQVECCDAAEADYSGGTIYWLFNPFGSLTLQTVVQRLHRSVADQPRLIRLVYVNPVHEDVLNQSGWLHRSGYVHSPFFGTYGASYWRSV